jgi:hypothetical protein
MRKAIMAIMIGAFVYISVIFGGQGEKPAATVSFDATVLKVEAGKEYSTAVVASDVRALYSYSFVVSYNDSIVGFVGAVKSRDSEKTAFLERNGGQTLVYMVKPGNGNVEVATTLSGSESSVAVDGSGVLGVLKFKAKAAGDPKIRISEVKLINFEGNEIRSK